MDKYIDNVRINDILYYKNNKDIYNKIYSFLAKNTSLSNEELLYIISLVFDKTIKDTAHESIHNYIIEELYKKYYENAVLLKKYYNSIKIINKKELLNYLNKSNSYSLFESINLDNVDYYSVIWETIFN